MAYTNEEYKVTVTGRLAGGEIWSNTWTILRIDTGVAVQIGVNQIRGFYNDFVALMSNDWHADAAHVRNLGTDVSFDAAWESFAGSSTADNLPTECACRVSLTNLAGVNGGPFIGGFTTSSLDSVGIIAPATVTAFVSALAALASGLDNEGFQLRIDRPTVGTTVAALQGKVGVVFDVIRKRRNDINEAYEVAEF